MSLIEALRAIIRDADQRPGGDSHYQEISRDVLCDARRALREHDEGMKIATAALGGSYLTSKKD